MKIKKFLLGLGFLTAMAACSSDDLVQAPTEQVPVDEQGRAYMTVSINSVGDAGSRANGTDPAFEFGTTDEQKVATADFYFYDAEGNFVVKANVWNGGASNGNSDKGPNATTNNIEFKSNTVIVLKGVNKKNFPTYLVTILNQPASFTAPETLIEMEKVLSKTIRTTSNEEGNFVMATTSWNNPSNNEPYFVTKVTEANFVDNEEAASEIKGDQLVTIYVERLATKVRFNNGLTTTSENGQSTVTYVIPLQVTVAGMDNVFDDTETVIYGVDSEGYIIDKEGNRIKSSEDSEEGIIYCGVDDNGYAVDSEGKQILVNGEPLLMTGATGAEYVYLKVKNWALNATAQKSHMVKNLTSYINNYYPAVNGNWNELSFTWNDPTNFRSYWGKSCTYDVKGTGESTDEDYNYITFNKLNTSTLSLGNATYCPENTHPNKVMTEAFSESVTSVLLLAQLYSDEDCTKPLDAVRFNGVLFTEQHFINYVLNAVNTRNHLNYYLCRGGAGTQTDPYNYTQVGSNDVELKSNNGSDCYVVFKESEDTPILYYMTKDSEGKETYTAYDNQASEITKLNGYLKEITPDENSAIRYNSGLMYYNIPIQHLANPKNADGSDNKKACEEGQYGVVRNHIYDLTLNSIANLGYGIFDPTEGSQWGNTPIIPDDPLDTENKYQVGVTINILSWKIVSQGVSL